MVKSMITLQILVLTLLITLVMAKDQKHLLQHSLHLFINIVVGLINFKHLESDQIKEVRKLNFLSILSNLIFMNQVTAPSETRALVSGLISTFIWEMVWMNKKEIQLEKLPDEICGKMNILIFLSWFNLSVMQHLNVTSTDLSSISLLQQYFIVTMSSFLSKQIKNGVISTILK